MIRTVTALLLAAMLAGCTTPHSEAGQVDHVVLMWLKNPDDRDALEQIEQTGRGFVGQIPGLTWVSFGRPLLDADGVTLFSRGVSEQMHILGGNDSMGVKVCHHGEHRWTTAITLHHVLLKIRIWLEAYEGHLESGHPLDHWLKHQ